MSPDEREAQWADAMRAALAGNEAAYRELLRDIGSWLRVRVRSRLQPHQSDGIDPEETVQEALLAIHLKRHTWRSSDPITPWVAAIARNKLVDQLRRRNRRAEVSIEDLAEGALDGLAQAESGAGHDVERILESLDARHKAIVQLVAIEGHSSRDAAARLGISEGALRVALHRCLRGLAKRLHGEES